MSILVDTSCWIHAFRYQESFEANILAKLLQENEVVLSSLIIAELFMGARGKKEIQFLKGDFLKLPCITGVDTLGIQIGELGNRLKKKGITVSMVDLTLSVLAIKNHLFLYSLDQHFKLIAKHSSLKLFEPLKQ